MQGSSLITPRYTITPVTPVVVMHGYPGIASSQLCSLVSLPAQCLPRACTRCLISRSNLRFRGTNATSRIHPSINQRILIAIRKLKKVFTQAEEGLGCLRLGDRLHTSRELQERMVEVLAQLTFPLLSTRLLRLQPLTAFML
mmetsp:Transcript_7569/g.15414  ORF Transcript_7569/g.15414 Transcript_7569/m.15414 type:complete len:142 (+) Transcript_7569:94-519(+)